jgi:transposase
MFAVIDANGKELDYRRISTEEDIIVNHLTSFEGKLNVAVEVGSMIYWAVDLLDNIGAERHVINTAHFKLITQSRKKTDKRDAYLMAFNYWKDNLPENVHIPSATAREARALLRARHNAIKQSTMIMNSTRGILKRIGLKFRAKYFRAPLNWHSLIDSDIPDYLKEIVTVNYGIWYEHQKAIVRISNKLLEYYKSDDRFKILQTFPGIGPITSTTLLASIDDINRFSNSRKLSSYFGLVPSMHQSGERNRHGSITRTGNSLVRVYLIETVNHLKRMGFCVKVGNEYVELTRLKNKYYRLVNSKSSINEAKVAIAHSIVHILYQMLKKREAFNPYLLTKT